MKICDKASLRGEVVIKAIDLAGNETILLEDKNMIVNTGRNMLATALTNQSSVYVNDVVFGIGGTLAGDPYTPLTVSATDTVVNIPVTSTPIKGTDYSFSSQISQNSVVSFSINIPTTTVIGSATNALDGQALSEIALMINSTPAQAFAIKRFAAITKSSAIALSIVWTVYL